MRPKGAAVTTKYPNALYKHLRMRPGGSPALSRPVKRSAASSATFGEALRFTRPLAFTSASAAAGVAQLGDSLRSDLRRAREGDMTPIERRSDDERHQKP